MNRQQYNSFSELFRRRRARPRKSKIHSIILVLAFDGSSHQPPSRITSSNTTAAIVAVAAMTNDAPASSPPPNKVSRAQTRSHPGAQPIVPRHARPHRIPSRALTRRIRRRALVVPARFSRARSNHRRAAVSPAPVSRPRRARARAHPIAPETIASPSTSSRPRRRACDDS